MSRFARERRVFFFEEPLFQEGEPHLRTVLCSSSGVQVLTPVLPRGLNSKETAALQRCMLQSAIGENRVQHYIAWYYTPMARDFAAGLSPRVTVYDCMDELSAFAGAPPAMQLNEKKLFEEADLVFTGGASLFESKRKRHPSVHLFPSSVDVNHFARARTHKDEPADQAQVRRPRLGYAGVIDERMDLDLLREVAARRPEWQLVLLGPVVKIDPASLPKASNIHYLGMKHYAELPAYMAGWDIGMLPFALNESTRFISPTKTPEYLAAGLPVLSTPIRDVINPYGELGLVGIANGPQEFISVAERLMDGPVSTGVRASIDKFLSQSSWNKTWSDMNKLIEQKLHLKPLAVGLRHSAARVGEGVPHV
jgi:glycosyltransferase involved in cell wall biosynthesis